MELTGRTRSIVRSDPVEPASAEASGRLLADGGEGTLLDQLPRQVWLCDASTLRFLDVNDAAVRELGYSREKFLAMSVPDLASPSDVAALRSAYARICVDDPDGGIWSIRTASGETVRADFSWRLLESRSVVLICVTDVTRFVEADDILLRSQTLQINNFHLKEQEANLRTAQRLLNLGVWTIDLVTGRLTWSDNVYEMYGVTCGSFGHSFGAYLELVHADDRDRTRSDYERFLALSEAGYSFDHRVLLPGGGVVHVRGIGERTRSNGRPILTGVVQDVTAQVEAAASLEQATERFRLLAMATNDVIWDWDLKNDTVWWNDGIRQHFGHDPASIGAGPESWTRNIDPADRDRVLQSVHSAIEGTGSKWLGEYRFLNAEGQPRTVIDRGFIIRNSGGQALRMLGSMLDITQQRELEDRLRQAQKLEAVGHLTGGIAHDFNNLLTVILGNAELLTEYLAEREDLRSLAETTVAAAERGAELTHRLLAFARQQSLDAKLVDFNTLVEDMESLIRRTLTADIEIALVRSEDPCIAEVDPGQLEGALLNLAINARDAMPGGGRLKIEVTRVAFGDEYPCPRDDVLVGSYACIRVCDSGSGMPADTLKQVFEPFFTTKPIGKGSGLGLSMVYGFVKQSRGHINIHSEPGEGTIVSLYFPLSNADEPSAPPETVDTNLSGGNEHILVVEDDQLVRKNLVAQLEKLGYRITSATHGTEALDLMNRIPPVDLLFTDLVMPGGINGHQLADAARKRSPELRVLFTSGHTQDAIAHKERLKRDVHLLSKPYRRQELAGKVRQALGSSLSGQRVRPDP